MKYFICLLLGMSLSACRGNDGDTVVGPQGIPGAPAVNINPHPVNWVQFCPDTTNYPNVFVEGGLLIDGKIYAVYSANNGFLTYLPPGSYSSNAIGSACNFVINEDGSITN